MKINLHNTVVESISTRKDGSIKVVLGMLEMPPQEMYDGICPKWGFIGTSRIEVIGNVYENPELLNKN